MAFEYIKALHIIFVTTWFAGLFYIVRLFIYQTEALEKPEEERRILAPQLNLMANRLWYIITWPSAILTLIFGFWVFYFRWGYIQSGFMQAKLGFVLVLYIYHFICHKIYHRQTIFNVFIFLKIVIYPSLSLKLKNSSLY